VELSWQPEMDDILDALHSPALPGNNAWRGTAMRLLLGAGVLWGLIALAVGSYAQVFGALAALIYLGGLLGWITYVSGSSPRARERQERQQRRQVAKLAQLWQKHQELQAPLRAVITPEHGIQIFGAQTVHYPWTSVRGVTETERSVVVHARAQAGAGVNLYSKIVFALGTTVRLALPKRALADDQLTELRALLVDGLGRTWSSESASAG
jgi:hypothetical protein